MPRRSPSVKLLLLGRLFYNQFKCPRNDCVENRPPDTDRNGMPDQWEITHGLNPGNAADGKVTNADGYTNLERYVNSLGCLCAPEFVSR